VAGLGVGCFTGVVVRWVGWFSVWVVVVDVMVVVVVCVGVVGVGGCKTIPLRADWRPRVFKEVHEDGKVVSPTHRPPLPPGNIPGAHFF
jgi:hypothetical protein